MTTKVKGSKVAICFLAILNTTEHLHPRAVLDAKLPPVSNDDDEGGIAAMLFFSENVLLLHYFAKCKKRFLNTN